MFSPKEWVGWGIAAITGGVAIMLESIYLGTGVAAVGAGMLARGLWLQRAQSKTMSAGLEFAIQDLLENIEAGSFEIFPSLNRYRDAIKEARQDEQREHLEIYRDLMTLIDDIGVDALSLAAVQKLVSTLPHGIIKRPRAYSPHLVHAITKLLDAYNEVGYIEASEDSFTPQGERARSFAAKSLDTALTEYEEAIGRSLYHEQQFHFPIARSLLLAISEDWAEQAELIKQLEDSLPPDQ